MIFCRSRQEPFPYSCSHFETGSLALHLLFSFRSFESNQVTLRPCAFATSLSRCLDRSCTAEQQAFVLLMSNASDNESDDDFQEFGSDEDYVNMNVAANEITETKQLLLIMAVMTRKMLKS